MAKKKKRSSKKPIKQAPQHELPNGFWSQAGAVVLIALSLLLVVAWFGVGGPVLNWLQDVALKTIGLGVYLVPFVGLYVAVETFRAEDNRLPFVMKFASVLLIAWLSGLTGLMKADDGTSRGGFVDDTLNSAMLSLVNGGVAIFVYLLLMALTVLFVLRISPASIIAWIRDLFATAASSEQAENVKIMKKAQATPVKSTDIGELKLNAGVPTLDPNESKKAAKLSSLRGSVQQDKAAEEQAALVAITDPNWKAPSLDLLEKKQNPADAGDVQQNAQTIHD